MEFGFILGKDELCDIGICIDGGRLEAYVVEVSKNFLRRCGWRF